MEPALRLPFPTPNNMPKRSIPVTGSCEEETLDCLLWVIHSWINIFDAWPLAGCLVPDEYGESSLAGLAPLTRPRRQLHCTIYRAFFHKYLHIWIVYLYVSVADPDPGSGAILTHGSGGSGVGFSGSWISDIGCNPYCQKTWILCQLTRIFCCTCSTYSIILNFMKNMDTKKETKNPNTGCLSRLRNSVVCGSSRSLFIHSYSYISALKTQVFYINQYHFCPHLNLYKSMELTVHGTRYTPQYCTVHKTATFFLSFFSCKEHIRRWLVYRISLNNNSRTWYT